MIWFELEEFVEKVGISLASLFIDKLNGRESSSVTTYTSKQIAIFFFIDGEN